MRAWFASLAGVVAVTVALGSSGWAALSRTGPLPPLEVGEGDPARGRHLVHDLMQCGRCHGPELTGGPAPGLLTPVAPNLTDLDDEAVARALWLGVGSSDRSVVHPPGLARLGPDDLAAVAAHIAQLPREQGPGPASATPALWLAVGAGLVPVAGSAPEPPQDAVPTPSPAYGRYLVELAGCHDCHQDLAGLRDDGWSGADFARAMQDGVGRGGPLDATMPRYPRLTDLELDAIWWALR